MKEQVYIHRRNCHDYPLYEVMAHPILETITDCKGKIVGAAWGESPIKTVSGRTTYEFHAVSREWRDE